MNRKQNNLIQRALVILFLPLIFANTMLAQINTALPVGAIPGAIDVSPMGEATYTIPIEVVPGTQGMQPNLSIVYSSMSGMGLLGMKWNLAGLSAITRCGQVPYFDNNITSIQFNGDDRFALNGSRLINLSGGNYCTIGSTYATEVEDFTRVVSYGGTANAPAYFKAFTDNGAIIEYGNTTNSKQKLGSTDHTILSWYINKITDENGNYMTFYYNKLNGEIWIDSIKYTGNTDIGLQPYAKVVFNYVILPDMLGNNTCFVGGYGVPQTKILTTITTYYQKSILRKYQFNYNLTDDGEYSPHLKEVVLHGEGGVEYLNATSITWGNNNATITCQSLSGLPGNFPNGKLLAGDFDGGRRVGAEVTDSQVGHLLDPGAGVIHEC